MNSAKLIATAAAISAVASCAFAQTPGSITYGSAASSAVVNNLLALKLDWNSGAPALGTPASVDLTHATNVPVNQAIGILPAANGGAGTTTGALKGNGSGAVSQAAASDLSNGVTGSGSVVLGTSPTITTPAIVGATNGASPAAGRVGEYHCAQVTNGGSPSGCDTNNSTPIVLTTATAANIASLSLTAGNWEVCAWAGTVPAGSTVTSAAYGAISLTSALLPPPPNGGAINVVYPPATAGLVSYVPSGCTRESFTITTTVYLVEYVNFTTSTLSGDGFLSARRTD